MQLLSPRSYSVSGAARAASIAAAYAVFAGAWILFSDLALARLVRDPEALLKLSVYKGFAFVLVTAALLFLLVRRAFGTIDRSLANFKESARIVAGRDRVLSEIAAGAPMGQSLALLVTFLEEQIPGSRCTVLLLDEDGQRVRHGAIATVPPEYAAAIDGAPIGPVAGSCGTAMFRRTSVFVADIATDPLWADYRHLALPHGLRACWSTPVLDADGRVLGSFAVYKSQPGLPTPSDERMMSVAAQLASVALGRERSQQALREGEERFTAFMDASPAIAWVTDEAGRHVYMNREWERAFARDRDEWLGRTAVDLVGPEVGARIQAHDRMVLEKDAPVEIDEDRFSIDGRAFVWHLHKFPFRNASGQRFIGGFAVDITDRAEAEAALREVELRLEAVVENLREGLIISDRSGSFVHWNPAALRMIGEEQRVPRRNRTSGIYDGFYGNFELRTLDGELLPRDAWPLARVRRGETLAEFEVEVRRIGSDWRRVFSYSGQLVPYASGHELAFLTLADITERKEAERQLRESRDSLERKVAERTRDLQLALERAESADRLKSAFLATMSHELRTPLNSIIGFTGIIIQGLAGPLNPEQAKQLSMVRGSARHLLALINDVLDLSKIEAGQLEVHASRFDLRDSIDRCVSSIRPMADRKGLALSVQLGDGIAKMISDQRRVEQILLNLLNNAVKFTETGSVCLHVESVAEATAPLLRFTVADTGIGIADAHLADLFQPFRQIDTGLTRQHEGTGLGLSICRRLSQLLGGSITVESRLGAGSRFIVTLPQALELRG